MDHDPANKVGYAKPPVHSRFQKGQSGNPKGRRKKSPGLSQMVKEVMAQKVPITKNGRTQSISLQRAVLEQLGRSAAQGKPATLSQLIKLLQKVEAADQQAEVKAQQEAETVDPLDQELLDTFEQEILARHGIGSTESCDAPGPRIIKDKPQE